MNNEPKFMHKDNSGRGFVATNITLRAILDHDDRESEDGEQMLHEWAQGAECGDTFDTEDNSTYTRTS